MRLARAVNVKSVGSTVGGLVDPRAKAILLFGGRGETYFNDF
jgi:hypothetical protein